MFKNGALRHGGSTTNSGRATVSEGKVVGEFSEIKLAPSL